MNTALLSLHELHFSCQITSVNYMSSNNHTSINVFVCLSESTNTLTNTYFLLAKFYMFIFYCFFSPLYNFKSEKSTSKHEFTFYVIFTISSLICFFLFDFGSVAPSNLISIINIGLATQAVLQDWQGK